MEPTAEAKVTNPEMTMNSCSPTPTSDVVTVSPEVVKEIEKRLDGGGVGGTGLENVEESELDSGVELGGGVKGGGGVGVETEVSCCKDGGGLKTEQSEKTVKDVRPVKVRVKKSQSRGLSWA